MNQVSNSFAIDYLLEVTYHIHVEHYDRQTIVFAHTDGREIHHFQSTCQHLLIRDILKLRGRRSFSGSAV